MLKKKPSKAAHKGPFADTTLRDEFIKFTPKEDRARLLDPLTEIFVETMARAEKLAEYSQLLSENADRSNETADVASDILRSAVVLLHATLEDFLRTLEMNLLPFSNAEILEKISLTGRDGLVRFSLGDLVAHRGKTILEVIRESVAEHLLKKSYSRTKDICALLVGCGFDIKSVATLLPKLNDLMKRRHSIVHRVDKTQGELAPITSEQVQDWIDALNNFLAVLLDKSVWTHGLY